MVLTRDEVDGLMAGLLTSDGRLTGNIRLGDWLNDNRAVLRIRYVSELRRNDRQKMNKYECATCRLRFDFGYAPSTYDSLVDSIQDSDRLTGYERPFNRSFRTCLNGGARVFHAARPETSMYHEMVGTEVTPDGVIVEFPSRTR